MTTPDQICCNCGEAIEELTFLTDEHLEGLVASGQATDAGDGYVALWVHVDGGDDGCDRMVTTAEPYDSKGA